eukprot:TRINITY_DN258_c0_g1_i1.p1 TRINITY_DN258_c0_g1~~TRINITY_DN258_c0_g1_i1.p1  ORF type:complete len:473 (+),score=116.91 TRINITY_DN258_c0_g1_i1:64-1482(+)
MRAVRTAARIPASARCCSTLPPFRPPTKYDGLSYEDALAKRRKYVSPTPKMWYEDASPVMLVEGSMQYMWDHTGKRYLDMYGGIVTISAGHSHPRVNEAVRRQLDKIQHTTTLYLHPLQGEYAEAIVKHLPAEHDWVVYFTNSGSEANDLAMLMARTYTGNYEYVVMRNCYHGMTEGTRGLTSARGWKWPPLAGVGIKHANHASKYRGVFGGQPDACSTCEVTGDCVCAKYEDDLRGMLSETCSPRVAGFLAEPIQGVGGVYENHPGYWPRTYQAIRDHGGVCTSDEVQTGWGRLGSHFWGFEYAGVVPDMIVGAKSIANGFPLGIVAAKREVAEAFRGAAHFNTYGGNPVSLAAGLETLRVIEEEGLQQNCADRGKELLDGFTRLQQKHPIIGDVRGRGLMVAIELVSDRKTKKPAGAEAMQVQEHLRDAGIVAGKCGTFGNVFRFVPPYCITSADVEFFLHELDKALSAL